MSDNAGSDETQTDRPDLSPDLSFVFEPPLREVLACLNGQGGETRVVGGAVRNTLLGHVAGRCRSGHHPAAAHDVIRRARGRRPQGCPHRHRPWHRHRRRRRRKPFEVTTLRAGRPDRWPPCRRRLRHRLGPADASAARLHHQRASTSAPMARCTIRSAGQIGHRGAAGCRFIGEPEPPASAEDYLRISSGSSGFRRAMPRVHRPDEDRRWRSSPASLDGLAPCIGRAGAGRAWMKLLPMPGALQSLEAMARMWACLQRLIGPEADPAPHIAGFARLGSVRARPAAM
jgi:hypothetical protein